MANWEALLRHYKETSFCVRPADPGPRDDLYRKQEPIPCTFLPGVEIREQIGGALVYQKKVNTSPHVGKIEPKHFVAWTTGPKRSCEAPKSLSPEPEEDIRKPPEEFVCELPKGRPDLTPGCPYDFSQFLAGKFYGRQLPGSIVIRVAGHVVFNREPVITSELPEQIPYAPIGVAPTAGIYAELTPSANEDISTKCTQIRRVEKYLKPEGNHG